MIAALEGAVKQFRTREPIWPLRIPKEPLGLELLIHRALERDAARFDISTLKSRTLLHFRWDDGAWWELWLMPIGAGVRLFCDSSPEESRILASGRRDSEVDTEQLFLQLLAESAGEIFGIEISGGPPSRVRSPVDRSQLVDFFVHLFEVAHMEDDVRSGGKSEDLRQDVERWLEKVSR